MKSGVSKNFRELFNSMNFNISQDCKKPKRHKNNFWLPKILYFNETIKRKVVEWYLLPLFLSKVVQCCYNTCEVQSTHLVGNLLAKILKDTHSNQEILSHLEDVWDHG